MRSRSAVITLGFAAVMFVLFLLIVAGVSGVLNVRYYRGIVNLPSWSSVPVTLWELKDASGEIKQINTPKIPSWMYHRSRMESRLHYFGPVLAPGEVRSLLVVSLSFVKPPLVVFEEFEIVW